MNGSEAQTQTQTTSAAALTLTVNLNPELARLPERLPRYRHESHCHRLFAVICRQNGHTCDNSNCRKIINSGNPMFCCLKCNFDLCGRCFAMPASNPIPLVGDDRIKDRIKIDLMSLMDVEIRDTRDSDDSDDDPEMIYASIPSVPAIENICSVCQVQTQLLHLHCHHICCFVCYQQIDKCPVCRAKRTPRLVKRVVENANPIPNPGELPEPVSVSMSSVQLETIISDTNYNEPD